MWSGGRNLPALYVLWRNDTPSWHPPICRQLLILINYQSMSFASCVAVCTAVPVPQGLNSLLTLLSYSDFWLSNLITSRAGLAH
jgi:hypothetical protein